MFGMGWLKAMSRRTKNIKQTGDSTGSGVWLCIPVSSSSRWVTISICFSCSISRNTSTPLPAWNWGTQDFPFLTKNFTAITSTSGTPGKGTILTQSLLFDHSSWIAIGLFLDHFKNSGYIVRKAMFFKLFTPIWTGILLIASEMFWCITVSKCSCYWVSYLWKQLRVAGCQVSMISWSFWPQWAHYCELHMLAGRSSFASSHTSSVHPDIHRTSDHLWKNQECLVYSEVAQV